jgi:hypothetical protein
MARYATASFEPIPDADLTASLARAPLDQYVVWNGVPFRSEADSIPDRVFKLINEAWEPMSLRTILAKAARLSGVQGLKPERVRNALRIHQSSSSACYLLVRRELSGDYLAVTDVPCPSHAGRISMGDIVVPAAARSRYRLSTF